MSVFFIFSESKKRKHADALDGAVVEAGMANGKAWALGGSGNQSAAEQLAGAAGITRLSLGIMAAFACSFFSVLLLGFTSLPCPSFSLHCIGGGCSPKPTSNSALTTTSLLLSSSSQRVIARPSLNQALVPVAASKTFFPYPTDLAHIVFGIAASSKLWASRKEYVKLWWRPAQMRGFVWLDKPMNSSPSMPPIKISSPTSNFSYTNPRGSRSAIRISRIVSETFRLHLPDVHWFVMGDDDTVFIPENLVKVLSKYNHSRYYYIGSNSESHTQNIHFSYNMAYGGGGFAISYPLAKALERIQDKCLQRYSQLFGSDDRLQACMAELGVPLTKEAGFHQFDVYGDASGLLMAHPVAPLVSIHHLDIIDPVFPNMKRLQALKHLKKSIKVDPAGMLQQSFCYDNWRNWSISVSWGYAAQVYRGLHSPRFLELPTRTFISWYRTTEETAYPFSSRPVSLSPCEQPVVFHMKNVSSRGDNQSESLYVRESKRRGSCKWKMASPAGLQWIHVLKEKTDESWHQAPRRQCCKILKSNRKNIYIQVRICREGELVA
ncbi:hypothetical protein O6H91_03G047100 [Diphasiastrum complanatum]|uniref:Uncharacterized protein n=1 Tax=Diphasiastrum complanatum TaxID=34168 RepID=A0ACC2E692_DIPCM|nr:hypothetical protein O6H91_03G047100 [Diphasiastrum complanatum]